MEQYHQNEFEKRAEKAENDLFSSSSVIDETMRGFSENWEKMEKESEKMLGKTAENLSAVLLRNITERKSQSSSGVVSSVDSALKEHLEFFPPELVNELLHKLLSQDNWKTSIQDDENVSCFFFFHVLSLLGERYSNNAIKENKGADIKDIEPMSCIFYSSDFPTVPDRVGIELPRAVLLEIRGNVGQYAGIELDGGTLIVTGTAEELAGNDMSKGILDIRGEVKSFSPTAFSKKNYGTILWRGVKIWENQHWTKGGEEMNKKGEIPIYKEEFDF